MKERFKAIMGVFAVFVRDNKILLARRCNTSFADGSYSLPAGHLEPGESLAAGMIRELEEEVGVKVEAAQLNIVHVQSYNAEDGHRIHVYFQVMPPYGEPQNKEPEKCDDLSWFPLDALPENTLPYVRAILERIQQGKMYSETMWNQ